MRYQHHHVTLPVALLAGLAATAIGIGSIAPQMASASSTTLALDTMTRTTSTGWGSATTGGAYSTSVAKTTSVRNGWAKLVSPAPGGTGTMTLSKVTSQNAVSRIDVSLPALPAKGSTVYISNFIRGQFTTSYSVMMVVHSDGTSLLVLDRRIANQETKFSTVTGPRIQPGHPVSLEISAVGTSSVRLGAKAWPAGTAEPAKWAAMATDSTSSRIVKAGPIGIAVYASRTGKVTPVTFDNLFATTSSTPAANPVTPAPTPTASSSTSKPSTTTSPSSTASSSSTAKPSSTATQTTTAATPSSTATQTATTATPTSPAADPGNGISYPGKRFNAGSAEPGSTSYPIPAGAIFVATNGSDSNPGTVAKPFRTISAATKAAKDHGTVVVRGGVYHEDVLIFPHTGLTVQAYPKEAVWLDGSEQVTGWTKSGSTWVRSGWTTFFDSSPTFTKGAADGQAPYWQFVNPSHPMAAHPDQIWINGAALTQVASRSAVVAGTFYVDQSAKQLVIGSDPTSKRVDVSTLSEAMSVRSTNGTIRGIGVRRYATSVPMMGSVSTYYTGVTFENMVIADNATTGLMVGAANGTVRNVTVRNNGLEGMGANRADGLTVTSLLSGGNNSQQFNSAPVSGAMKITTSRNVSVTGSSFINSYTQGPWFDLSCTNVTFSGNDMVGNAGRGVTFELADHVTAVNNLAVNNSEGGMFVLDTSNATIWNNTFAGNNGGTLDITRDDRGSAGNISVGNNVLSQSSGPFILRGADWTHALTSSQIVTQSDGNLFHKPSATTPPTGVWYPDGKTYTTYPTLAAFQKASGRETHSQEVLGTSPLAANYALTPAAASRAAQALPVPAAVAAATTGLTAGQHQLGAVIR